MSKQSCSTRKEVAENRMNTTFALLKKNNAKPSLIKKMAKILGGIKKYGKDAPIPIVAILNFRGLEDAIWALRAVLPEHEAEAKVFALRFESNRAAHPSSAKADHFKFFRQLLSGQKGR
jgi:hypothetical protein